MASTQSETLGLSPVFERAVVCLCATNPSFYGRIGCYIDVDSLSCTPAQNVVKAVHGIAGEHSGKGPSQPLVVIQWLTRLKDQGKCTFEEIRAVNKYINDGLDMGLPEEEEAVSELAAVLKRRMQKDIVREATGEFGRGGDFSEIARRIEEANQLGKQDTTTGTVLSLASFEDIEALRRLDRLPTGVMELDVELGGGMPRGTETVIIAPAKGGKSMSLTQILANAALLRYGAYEATLELPTAHQLARLKANLTGVPIDSIMNGSLSRAKARLAQLLELGLGHIEIKDFTAKAATADEVIAWVRSAEKQSGKFCDVLLVDYAGLLTTERDQRSYEAMKTIHTTLRNFAKDENRWVVTAEQPQRKSKGRKRIGTDDVADSMHTSRTPDLILSINPLEEGDQLEWVVAGSRFCPTGAVVGPLPHDFACGRVAPIDRREPWTN